MKLELAERRSLGVGGVEGKGISAPVKPAPATSRATDGVPGVNAEGRVSVNDGPGGRDE